MGRYVGIEWPAGWEDCGRVRGGAECPRCSNQLVYATRKDGSFGSIVGCDNCLIMSKPGSRELVVVSQWTQQGTELIPFVPAIEGTIVPTRPVARSVVPLARPAIEAVVDGQDGAAVALIAIARELVASGMIEYVNGAPRLHADATSYVGAAELRLLGDLLKIASERQPCEATRAAIERRRGTDRRSGSRRHRGDQPGRDRRESGARPVLVSGAH